MSDESKKKIIIIGAGPGGLTSAMILSHRGFDVEVYEKNSQVGGRNGAIEFEGFKFDIGPTFLMMKFILDEVFHEAGKDINNYLKFIKLDPMYSLRFTDLEINPTSDKEKMLNQISKLFPGNEKGYENFIKREKIRFERMIPCLQKEYTSFKTFFHPDFIRAIPYFSIGKSMYGELGRYFNKDKLRMSFTFQSKYLGMSPWECPAAFMLIPYVEHAFGIYHPIGGLSEISVAMSKAAEENGAKIYLKKPVKELILEGKDVKGIILESGEKVYADETIINADFGYAATNLFPKDYIKKYSKEKLEKKNFSCSTFMLYIGLDKIYDLPHHTIFFSNDYESYVKKVFKSNEELDDISIYVRNASINDKTLAPKGNSGLYILVPVQNNRSDLNWDKLWPEFRKKVISILKERAGMKDIEKHIVAERIITPKNWEKDMNVYIGATFNLAHSLNQMLYFRPRNKFEEANHCYLVGGGTHPGSGLPTIYESGRITANMISREHKVNFVTNNIQVSGNIK